jgi:hypothetical protein
MGGLPNQPDPLKEHHKLVIVSVWFPMQFCTAAGKNAQRVLREITATFWIKLARMRLTLMVLWFSGLLSYSPEPNTINIPS